MPLDVFFSVLECLSPDFAYKVSLAPSSAGEALFTHTAIADSSGVAILNAPLRGLLIEDDDEVKVQIHDVKGRPLYVCIVEGSLLLSSSKLALECEGENGSCTLTAHMRSSTSQERRSESYLRNVRVKSLEGVTDLMGFKVGLVNGSNSAYTTIRIADGGSAEFNSDFSLTCADQHDNIQFRVENPKGDLLYSTICSLPAGDVLGHVITIPSLDGEEECILLIDVGELPVLEAPVVMPNLLQEATSPIALDEAAARYEAELDAQLETLARYLEVHVVTISPVTPGFGYKVCLIYNDTEYLTTVGIAEDDGVVTFNSSLFIKMHEGEKGQLQARVLSARDILLYYCNLPANALSTVGTRTHSLKGEDGAAALVLRVGAFVVKRVEAQPVSTPLPGAPARTRRVSVFEKSRVEPEDVPEVPIHDSVPAALDQNTTYLFITSLTNNKREFDGCRRFMNIMDGRKLPYVLADISISEGWKKLYFSIPRPNWFPLELPTLTQGRRIVGSGPSLEEFNELGELGTRLGRPTAVSALALVSDGEQCDRIALTSGEVSCRLYYIYMTAPAMLSDVSVVLHCHLKGVQFSPRAVVIRQGNNRSIPFRVSARGPPHCEFGTAPLTCTIETNKFNFNSFVSEYCAADVSIERSNIGVIKLYPPHVSVVAGMQSTAVSFVLDRPLVGGSCVLTPRAVQLVPSGNPEEYDVVECKGIAFILSSVRVDMNSINSKSFVINSNLHNYQFPLSIIIDVEPMIGNENTFIPTPISHNGKYIIMECIDVKFNPLRLREVEQRANYKQRLALLQSGGARNRWFTDDEQLPPDEFRILYS